MTALSSAPIDKRPEPTSPGHFGVAEVIRGVGNALRRAYPTHIWVKGEVSDYRPATAGHHYFDLVERLPDGSKVVLPCAIWKSSWAKVGQKLQSGGIALTSGQEMLFQGAVKLYDGAGKLTFHVSDVYPEFTLGRIEGQRRAVLARLRREKLIGMNRRVEMPAVPLRVAVVSSRSAAGLRDFEEVLSQSGYAFSVLRYEVPVQGPMVEKSVCRALEVLGTQQAEQQIDVVCIVRGGGSATDLGWWNSYDICAAIARLPIPVITGIGHERDRVAADEVAHAAAPTPTAAAEILCSLARAADSELREATERMAAVVNRHLTGGRHALEAYQRAVTQTTTARVSGERLLIRLLRDHYTANARRTLAPHADSLARFHQALERDGDRALRGGLGSILALRTALANVARQQARRVVDVVAETIDDLTTLARRSLDRSTEQQTEMESETDSLAEHGIGQSHESLAHLADMVRAYDPVHVLRRGFSITLNSQGKAIRSAADLVPGETITTRLAAGRLASTITTTHRRENADEDESDDLPAGDGRTEDHRGPPA